MRPRTCTDVGDGGEEKARAAPAAPGQSSALESGDLPTLTALLPPAASVSTHRRRVTQLRFWVQRSERTSFQRKKERARDTEIQMSPSGKENPSFELGVGRAPSSLSSEDGPHRRSGAEAGLRPPSRESALWCPSRPRLSPRVPHTHTHTHTHGWLPSPLSGKATQNEQQRHQGRGSWGSADGLRPGQSGRRTSAPEGAGGAPFSPRVPSHSASSFF